SRSPDFAGKKARFTGLKARHRDLIVEMHRINREPPASHARLSRPLAALVMVGRAAAGIFSDVTDLLLMSGELSVASGRVLVHPGRFRLPATVYHLFRVGWQAVPIMALITFLIGGIIAQQGGEVTAIYPCGGVTGQLLAHLVEREHIVSKTSELADETRQ